MKWLRRILGGGTAEDYRNEQLRLVTKAGRRCAYDLRHAACSVTDPVEQKVYYDRAHMWLRVFNPGNDGKNYRDELHREINRLERHVERLQELCDSHGIDHHSREDIPF